MTLWNPMNAFSSQQRSVGDEPTASFDPSRTGDPLGPSPGSPAIGIGGASVGGAAAFGDPRRHPIGFAPSEEQTAVTRYRTEISFKRHHEQPRASAVPGPADGPEPAPSTLEVGASDAVVELDQSTGAAEATPFYKREISFRRKRGAPEETAAVTDAGESNIVEDAEVVAQAVDDLEPTEAVAEQDAPAITATESIPFYKREIGFGRKRTTPEEAATVTAAVEPAEELVPEPVDGDTAAQRVEEAWPLEPAPEPVEAVQVAPTTSPVSAAGRARRGSGGRGRGDGSGLGCPSR